MTQQQDEQPGLPTRIQNWLRSLQGGLGSQPTGRVVRPSSQPNALGTADLLKRAAQCYASAGWTEDACRLFEVLGDPHSAAPFYERQGSWEQAARCYAQSGEWSRAARCYQACDQANQAAECFLKAGQALQATWIWAHQTHQFLRAETEANQIKAESEFEQLAIQLILSRCEVGTGARLQAAKRLGQVVERLRTLPPNVNWRQLYEWAIAIAEVLHRPDLTICLHSTATTLNISGLQETWEQWSVEVLGEATGVVMPDVLESLPLSSDGVN